MATAESSSNLAGVGRDSLSSMQDMERIQSFNPHGLATSEAGGVSLKSVASSGSLEYDATSDTSRENPGDLNPGMYLDDSSPSGRRRQV